MQKKELIDMYQVFRRVLDTKGKIRVIEVPAPSCGPDQVLVASRYTAISVGTEGATLGKTFPELVKQTLQDPWMKSAVKNLIFGAAPETIKNIVWDEVTRMRVIGYSGSGVVLKTGKNVNGIQKGDRVAFAAQGHAEIVAPSSNLTIPIPDSVSFQEAAFVTVGGIAMQGVRRAGIQLGDRVAVIGLGLVGQLVSQLVNAAGGHVIGVDVATKRLDELGTIVPQAMKVDARGSDPVQAVLSMTGGFGADAVIVCAASKDPSIANQAMKMTRKQGRVVFVGIVNMDLERMPFFRNELDLRFSRAYGPGSYDAEYESGRIDYPQHYVRWTEQRNLAEFIRLLQEGRIQVQPMIGGIFPVGETQNAYDQLNNGTLPGISALLEYKGDSETAARRTIAIPSAHKIRKGKINIGVIGCGNFMRTTQLPNLYKNRAFQIRAIASATGSSAASVVSRYGIGRSTTDYHDILSDPEIDAVLIATRHHMHGPMACEALRAGKHVLVEKPAVLNWEQYRELEQTLLEVDRIYMVGYNRRYAPLAVELKKCIKDDLGLMVQYQVCVPRIPPDHWTLNPVEGGGRLIGEAEHFFDFINFLAGESPTKVTARCILQESETVHSQFNFMVDLEYKNRALATVIYTSYAAVGSSRETISVYQDQKTLTIDDFKRLMIRGGKRKTQRRFFADMGHAMELDHFSAAIKHGLDIQPVTLLAASRTSLRAMDSLKNENKGL
ncbi:MAG: bi-domain-containing oxidoreductase [Deltaproteobacteria bacterium]|nr:bi-domain-containing oxidoreductase [Deltaproteobacteria bacterium]